MTKFYTDQTKDYGKKADYQSAAKILNGLTPKDHGVLLDCILAKPNNTTYPNGIAKPIAFLEAVNLKDKLMIIMVEYKLHFPPQTKEREIALEIKKSNFKVYKEKTKLNFIYNNEQPIQIKLYNSFDFPYVLDRKAMIPTYSFLDWAKSPFI